MSIEDKVRSITSKLLIREAESRGWKVEVFLSSLSTPEAILRAEKNGKEFFTSSSLTSLTPGFAYFVAADKHLTYALLSSVDISVPNTLLVREEDVKLDEAKAFLKKYGRVVAKPTNTDHGDGITINITDEKQLIEAISFAREASVYSRSMHVLVQEQIEGKEYRFLVVDGKCVAVANRRPAFVVGDGKKTVEELIEEKNKNPLRGEDHTKPLTKISIEEVARVNGEDFLKRIPTKGEELEVLKTSNLSRGGEAVNCTDIASPELKSLAERAAVRCSLGVAGVDIITTNIEGGGKNYIIEVNSFPGIRMHMFPSVGKPINVAKYIIKSLERAARPINQPVKRTIGRSEYIKSPLFGEGVKVPARIDTGARVASVWASNISMTKDGKLRFRLFDKGSEYYTGEMHETEDYNISVVRNSTGQEEMRFRIKMPITIAGKKIVASFNLSDRSANSYPILIGRNVINNKFSVDVTRAKCKNEDEKNRKAMDTENNETLGVDPYKFYEENADKIVGVKK